MDRNWHIDENEFDFLTSKSPSSGSEISEVPNRCHLCEKTLSSHSSALRVHLYDCIFNEQSCLNCDLTFINPRFLKQHHCPNTRSNRHETQPPLEDLPDIPIATHGGSRILSSTTQDMPSLRFPIEKQSSFREREPNQTPTILSCPSFGLSLQELFSGYDNCSTPTGPILTIMYERNNWDLMRFLRPESPQPIRTFNSSDYFQKYQARCSLKFFVRFLCLLNRPAFFMKRTELLDLRLDSFRSFSAIATIFQVLASDFFVPGFLPLRNFVYLEMNSEWRSPDPPPAITSTFSQSTRPGLAALLNWFHHSIRSQFSSPRLFDSQSLIQSLLLDVDSLRLLATRQKSLRRQERRHLNQQVVSTREEVQGQVLAIARFLYDLRVSSFKFLLGEADIPLSYQLKVQIQQYSSNRNPSNDYFLNLDDSESSSGSDTEEYEHSETSDEDSHLGLHETGSSASFTFQELTNNNSSDSEDSSDLDDSSDTDDSSDHSSVAFPPFSLRTSGCDFDETKLWTFLAYGLTGSFMFPLRPGALKTLQISFSSPLSTFSSSHSANPPNMIISSSNPPLFFISSIHKQKGHQINQVFLSIDGITALQHFGMSFGKHCPTMPTSLPPTSRLLQQLCAREKIEVPPLLLSTPHSGLTHTIIRRAFASLVHYLYYRNIMSIEELIAASHMMAHSISEASRSYNCLQSLPHLYHKKESVNESAQRGTLSSQELHLCAQKSWNKISILLADAAGFYYGGPNLCHFCGNALTPGRDIQTHSCYAKEKRFFNKRGF
jgi:hypothetical protein